MQERIASVRPPAQFPPARSSSAQISSTRSSSVRSPVHLPARLPGPAPAHLPARTPARMPPRFPAPTGDVKLVRWPAESARRERYQALGVLRLLVVEGGAPAPVCSDLREDWVRPPTTEGDLRARMAALRARAAAQELPQLDPCGILRLGDRTVAVSPTEAELLECLVQRFRSLVPKAALLECLPGRDGAASRNALDLHIMRLRRRICPVGLGIRTVHRRGYLLEPLDDGQPVQAGMSRLLEFPRPALRGA